MLECPHPRPSESSTVKVPAIIFSVVLCTIGTASAQNDANVLWTAHGDFSHDAIGHKLHETHDLDGDSTLDFFSINAWADTNSLNNNGLIQARSGVDGSVLWRHEGDTDGLGLGRRIMRPHDVNGDDIHDLLILSVDTSTQGLVENGFLRCISGADGSVLWERRGVQDYERFADQSAQMLDDVNGDGAWDLIVASSDFSSNGLTANGYVAGISGADGTDLWRVEGTVDFERLGSNMLLSREFDADDFRDLVLSNPNADLNGLFHNGYVTALSGATGNVLWRVEGTGNNRMLGQNLNTTQDLDGDGRKDLVINDPDGATGFFFQNGVVEAFSGATGASLWQVDGSAFLERFGASIDLGQDINGDGKSDLFLGTPDDSSGGMTANGKVQALSGADGSTLWTTSGSQTSDMFGASLAVYEDVDGDTFPDLLTVNPDASVSGLVENGCVAMVSAATGAVLWRVEGPVSNHHLGQTVGLPKDIEQRDLNGDGTSDVILGTPYADLGGFSNNGELRLLDGATGATLWTTFGPGDDERLGDLLDVEDDLDGDGAVDIISSSRYSDVAGYTNNGSVRAYSGATGGHLWHLAGGDDDEYLGNARATIIAFDVDGDGISDVLASTSLADTEGLVDNGYVVCVSAGMRYPISCTPLVAGQPATITVSGLVPGSATGMVRSMDGPGHSRVRNYQTWVGMANPTNLVAGVADAAGNLSFTGTVPGGLSGRTIRLQAITQPVRTLEASAMLVREIQ